jgi:hypothetical protein
MSQHTDDPDTLLHAVQRRAWWRHLLPHLWQAGVDAYGGGMHVWFAGGIITLLALGLEVFVWTPHAEGWFLVLYLGAKGAQTVVGFCLAILTLGAWRLWRETHHHRERDLE